MADSKPALISKFTGMYDYLCAFEELVRNSNEAGAKLEEAEKKLKQRKSNVVRSILVSIFFVVCLLLIIFDSNLQDISLEKISAIDFSSLPSTLSSAGKYSAGLALFFLILAAVNLFLIPKSKSEIEETQDLVDKASTNFERLFGAMSEGKDNLEKSFSCSNFQYPPSRYVKYGVDLLNSGRADDFKEVMSLIDDLAHKERMVAEAEKQTRYAEATLTAAINAENAARAARSAARSAEFNTFFR
jgi:hypothetical protein